MEQQPEMLHLSDAAKLLKISVRGLYRGIETGRIPRPIRLGPQTLRYSRRSLMSWIDDVAKEAAK